VTVEVFIDYRSLDLISKKVGETDFIIHSKPAADTEQQQQSEVEQEKGRTEEDQTASSSPNDLKRTNSDEEDKGLITEELLRGESVGAGAGTMTAEATETEEEEEEDEAILKQPQLQSPPEPVTTVRLEDVLILKIENGRDYFLTVSADFAPTAEGNSLLLPCPTISPCCIISVL
jgi:hypothetical protein